MDAGQRLTIEQALGLITRDSAYGTFDEGLKGTLSPGKLADLVVLSANPLAISPQQLDHLLTIQVLLTMIGGRAAYCRPGAEDIFPAPAPGG
jgi:predicted amidohydrolase YtcJ